MKIILILWITIFTSNSYSLELKVDFGAVTDALEKVTEELSENLKTEEVQVQEDVKVKENVQSKEEVKTVEEVQTTEEININGINEFKVQPLQVIFEGTTKGVTYQYFFNVKSNGVSNIEWKELGNESNNSSIHWREGVPNYFLINFENNKYFEMTYGKQGTTFPDLFLCMKEPYNGEVVNAKNIQLVYEGYSCQNRTHESEVSYIFDFEDNTVQIPGWDISEEIKIIKHNHGNNEKVIGKNFISTNELKTYLETCEDIKNNQIDVSKKGYKDIFFGMSKSEFFLLGECNGGHTPLDQEANDWGEGFRYFELYKYPVVTTFGANGVNKIIVTTASEYGGKTKFSNGNSGFIEIDEIKEVLIKKYNLLSEPSERDISRYNQFDKMEISRPKLDYVFENNDSKNLIIYRIYNSQTTKDWFYVSEILYLDKWLSKNYLEEKKSETVSEDDF